MNDIDRGGLLLVLSGGLFCLATILLFYARNMADFGALLSVIFYSSASVLFSVFALISWVFGWNKLRNFSGGKGE
jgi:hypothetical protein